jgi:hypothetical protein
MSTHIKSKGKRPNKKSLAVGITNLGCVCYMSAMMQLFYHLP